MSIAALLARQAGSGVRPTTQDQSLLRMIARYRYATVPQIQRLWPEATGVVPQTVYKRVRRLQRAGLLRQRTVLDGDHAIFIPTPMAYDWLSESISLYAEQAVALGSYAHTIAVATVAAEYERDHPGRVLSEREVAQALYQTRRERRKSKAPIYVPRTARREPGQIAEGPWAITRWGTDHAPDLVVETDQGMVAVEVELTKKPHGKNVATIEAFLADPRFTRLVWWVPTIAIRQAIDAAIHEVITDGFAPLDVTIRRYRPTHNDLVKPTRAAA